MEIKGVQVKVPVHGYGLESEYRCRGEGAFVEPTKDFIDLREKKVTLQGVCPQCGAAIVLGVISLSSEGIVSS